MRATIARTVPTLRVLAIRLWRALQCRYMHFRIHQAARDLAALLEEAEHLRRDLDLIPLREELTRKFIQALIVQLADLHRTTP